MTTTKRNLTNRQASAAIDAREPFSNATGSLRGEINPLLIKRGWLNDDEWARLHADHGTGWMSYVVYSYDTPIAWVMEDGTRYRVEQKFSPTTSKHMGLTFLSSPAKVEA